MQLIATFYLAIAFATPYVARLTVVDKSASRVTLRASTSSNTKSVAFRMNGKTRVDSTKPFQVKISPRTSSVQATAYSRASARGTRGRALIYRSSPSVVLPIPSLSKWEENMVSRGRAICNQNTIKSLSTWEGNAWYYDGMRVFYQIADYTKDSSWNQCARYVRDIYRKYVLDSNGVVGGWRVFPHGLYEDFRRTGDTESKRAALLLAQRSAFAESGGGAGFELSRETAYIIHAYLIAEKLGAGRNANLAKAVNYAISHIDQWASSSSYVRPFMVGLTMEALVHYHEATGDSRAQAAVKKAADWLWNNLWRERDGSFPYSWCRGNGSCPNSSDDGDGPDLNLLISPAYSWLYARTKDPSYATKADKIFDGGVRLAYLGNGKHFNQNYRWSFSGVGWRRRG